MSDEETPAKTGDAAWREQRDAISKRNAEAHKRAQTEKRAHTTHAQDVTRNDAKRETEQLEALNKKLEKQQARRAR